MSIGRSILLAGTVAMLAGCGGKEASKEKAGPPALKRGTTSGRFLVCVMDVSASMKHYDRNRYTEQGAQLAVALLTKSTSFGAVAFSSGAWVQADMTRIKGNRDRTELQARLGGIPRQGSTNFVGALATARSLILKRMAADSNGAVIFLTDGEPTVGGTTRDVKAEVEFYATMKWPIYTIGLSDKADTDLLRDMAAKTGGAHFSALKSEQLLSAFVDIVSLTEGYFVKRGKFTPITVMPDTDRLIYMVSKGSPQAGIGDATLKDGEAKYADMWRFPKEKGSDRYAVDLLSFEKPEEGTWRADTVGAITDWTILQKPPFELSVVAQQPRAKYVEGQAVHLAVLATAQKKATLVELHRQLTVESEVFSEKKDDPLDEVKLSVEGGDETPEPLVYHGTTTATLVEEDKGEVLAAELYCDLTWGEQEVWTHRKIVSFQVVPATGLFAVQPEELDFGAFWSDSKGADLKISVLSNQEQAMFQLASEEKSLSFEPKLLEVAEGEEREVAVTFDPGKVEVPGELENEATVTLDIGDVSGKTWTESVKVMASVFKLNGPEFIELPDTPPGFPVSYEIMHSVSPESELVFELSDLVHTTLGPDEIKARALTAEEQAEKDKAASLKARAKAAAEVAAKAAAARAQAEAEETPAVEDAPAVEPAVVEPAVEEPAAEETPAEVDDAESAAEAEETPAGPEVLIDPERAKAREDEDADEAGLGREGPMGLRAEGDEEDAADADADAAEDEADDGAGLMADAAAEVEESHNRSAPRLRLELIEVDGKYQIKGDVPLDVPSGYYVGTLTVSIPEESRPARPSERPAVPAPKKIKVMIAVGDMQPSLAIVHDVEGTTEPLTEIKLAATERGWVEARMKFVLQRADTAELQYDKAVLVGPGGAKISSRWSIQLLPQNDWDGKVIKLGGDHELVYRVFAKSDLVQGEYSGELPVKMLRHGEVIKEIKLPITVDVNLN